MGSVSFHIADRSHYEAGTSRFTTASRSAWKQMSRGAVLQIYGLAVLYAANNQLSFYVYTMADPGTVYLFKAASTMIVASIQCTCVGKEFTAEQWQAMFLQGVGMVVVQHNPCKGAARYNPLVYLLMTLSAMLTAACSVRNEYLVKNYSMLLNVQNAVLYAAGALLNLVAFCIIPNPNSKQANIGFFDGYDNPLALGVVFVNSLIGLAITAVYKYADAITKCIASDLTAVNLCIISSIFFELVPSLTMWCGVVVVCFAVHFYTSAAPAPPARKPAISETQFLKDEEEDPDEEGSDMADSEAEEMRAETELALREGLTKSSAATFHEANTEETEMEETLGKDNAFAGRVVGKRQ